MTNTAFFYGTISGLITVVGLIVVSTMVGQGNASSMEWLGYLLMILALSMIFFGIKRHRDHEGGGVIKFGTALLLGVGITLVASIIYVLVWEVYDASTNRTFIDVYTASVIAAQKANGISGPALDASIAEMAQLKTNYADPLFRLPMTFLEIFPVGLVVTLISAALLRNSRVLPARA